MRRGGIKERYLFYKVTGKLPYKAGRIDEELMYRERMKDVARENYLNWGYNSPQQAWQDLINNPTYDYRGYYSDPRYLNVDSNADVHWPDTYKTPQHKSFSSDSKYSGEVSDKNPYGLRGGVWIGDKFVPAAWQSSSDAFKINHLPHYEDGKDARTLEYNTEGDYYYGGNLFGKGNELVVKGSASPKLYMHPWKTERDYRQELNEYINWRLRNDPYYAWSQDPIRKDLSKPLSPVDPAGEFVVGNAVMNPAFKYLFGGVGKEVLDEGLIQLGKRGNKWARAKSFYRAAGDPEIVENIRFDIPKLHKQKYPTKVKYSLDRNYKNPIKNILSSLLLDAMRGKYIGHGAERTVFEDKRYPNRVIKIGGGLNADEKITDFDGLNEAIDYALEINKLPGVEPVTYEGFSESNGIFTPWFSLKRVTPFQKVADPWETLTKHYILPNGKKVNTGKLSRIRMIDTDKAFRPLGYEPDVRNVGRFYVKNYPYTVGDLGQKNIGIDEIGRLRIFDPLIDL